MAKHGKKKGEQEIIDLKAYQAAKEKAYSQTEAHIEYEEEPEEAPKKRLIPKAVYRVAIILLVVILGLAVWVNREALRPDRVFSWIRLQFTGEKLGDGFPMALPGTAVAAENFRARGGEAAVLSDTAYSQIDREGRVTMTVAHGYTNPTMALAGDKTLVMRQGGKAFKVLSGEKTVLESEAPSDITCGAVAANGRFALGLQGGDGASELRVYQADGTLQYQYTFAKDQITAVALNYDGTYGVVCTAGAEKGELVGKLTVLYFNEAEPVSQTESRNNLFLKASWTDSGEIFAIGDTALLRGKSPEYSFAATYYDGRKLTASLLEGERAYLSLSAYEHAGPSTLLVFRGSEEPVRVEFGQRVLSISAAGSTVGVLCGGEAVFLENADGTELGRVAVNADAKGLALCNESLAYVLGAGSIELGEMGS